MDELSIKNNFFDENTFIKKAIAFIKKTSIILVKAMNKRSNLGCLHRELVLGENKLNKKMNVLGSI